MFGTSLMFSFTNVLHIIIIFQGVLLALYILVSNTRKSKSDLFLAFIIGTMAIQVLGLFMANRGVASDFFQSINCIYGFLYGPLLLYYNKHMVQRHFAITVKDALHLIPFLIFCIGLIASNGSICRPEVFIGYAVHILFYILLCLRELRRHKRVMKDSYSGLEWLNLNWLHWVFVVFCLIVLVDIGQFIAFLAGINTYYLENTVFLLMMLAINLLYFHGFTTSRKPFGYNKDDLEFSASLTSRKRIDMELEENIKLISQLEKYMMENEPFKKFDLTIAMLADEIGIPKRRLSELINDHYAQNFVDFINTYRIDSAKKKLMNPVDSRETILEVLYAVGFNSKSSFNTAFKTKTGLTPSQFKARHR
ncbi:MAG: helix-turn-helix domain-containing protein [Bacteroidota bacterium]